MNLRRAAHVCTLLLSCLVGMSQWKVDWLAFQCDGSAALDIKAYVLERRILAPQFTSCPICCDETCATQCAGTCVTYITGAWLEVDRTPDPGAGPDVCFDWDASPAGDHRGTQTPGLEEVWWLNAYALDQADNKSAPCIGAAGGNP